MANALTAFLYLLAREEHVSVVTMQTMLDGHGFRTRGIKGYRLSNKNLEREVEEIVRVLED